MRVIPSGKKIQFASCRIMSGRQRKLVVPPVKIMGFNFPVFT
jgi:hypothetical protein